MAQIEYLSRDITDVDGGEAGIEKEGTFLYRSRVTLHATARA